MDAITRHHFRNIAEGNTVENEDGSLSTVRTIGIEINGREVLIPTVWNGEIVSDKKAKANALDSGIDWPSADATTEGRQALNDFDTEIHKDMSDQTTVEEALEKLKVADRNKDVEVTLPNDASLMDPIYLGLPQGTVIEDRGPGIVLTGETFPDGSPMWEAVPEEETISKLAPATSLRPPEKPSPEYFAEQEKQQFEDYKLQLQSEAYQENLLAEKDKREFDEHKAQMQYEEYVRVFGEDDPTTQLAKNEFAPGGLATARKGITTEEGRDMANKKYQRDDKDADTNKDGTVSTREGVIEDAKKKNEIVEMSHGGMMSGLMGGMMGYDEVSGNPIPIGSNPENVRDDIDAKLSTDEYVMPAHVVKWHGLKQIQMMQAEAEMGLMSMQMDGLIQSEDTPEAEEAEEEEIEESDEDIDVEVATFKVDDKLDDSDEIVEISPRISDMPLMQKNKYSFAV